MRRRGASARLKCLARFARDGSHHPVLAGAPAPEILSYHPQELRVVVYREHHRLYHEMRSSIAVVRDRSAPVKRAPRPPETHEKV